MKLADPAALSRGPRRFVAYWLRDLVVSHDERGLWAFLPLRLLICTLVGGGVGYVAEDAFFTDRSDRIAFFAGILAVNAILLAVCWAAFAKIYDTLSDKEFGAWVRHHRAHGYYDFYVEFIQLAQMIAVVIVLFSLVLTIAGGVPPWLSRVALGASIGTSLYAGWWASGCVRIMQELADQRAAYAEFLADGKIRPLSAKGAER
jgi:hypothetical protein